MKFKTLKIKSIKSVGLKETYDITMAGNEPSYLANNIVVHNSGQAQMYINRKTGKEQVDYPHPTLIPITKDTRGVILYQEQIMQIMNQVGGMSWATAEMARKVITKSKGKDAFNKMRDEFVRNANKIHGMPLEEAEQLYDTVSTFGSYSFNKSHAVGYSILAYWGAWLKTYYPLHFYKAVLKHESDETKLHDAINEAKEINIDFEYPDINKSHISYELVDGKIYAGLNSVIGLGDKIANKIIEGRKSFNHIERFHFDSPYKSISDFKNRIKISEKLLKGLIVSDAFRAFNINKKAEYYQKHTIKEDFDELEWAKLIYEHTKLKPKVDLISAFNFGDYKFVDIKDLDENVGSTHQFIRGMVTAIINKDKLIRPDVANHVHKFDRHMIYLNVNDGTGNIACQVNPCTYEKYVNIINSLEKQPVVVYGALSKDGRKMYADMIQVSGTNFKTDNIDRVFKNLHTLNKGEHFIVSAQPAVSKKMQSYYRLKFSNGSDGMLFRPSVKLFPGMKVTFKIITPPFIDNLKILDATH